MAKFRKARKVTNDEVNLSFVHLPIQSSSELVSIEGDEASNSSRRRHIMYADLTGRLIAANGDPQVNTLYPAVTDMFFDTDNDKQLDANEVYPEAALAFHYQAKRHYYGPPTASAESSSDEVVSLQVTSGSNGTNTLSGGSSWATNQWVGYSVEITSGTQVGTRALIISNTSNTLTIERELSPTTATSSTYNIFQYVAGRPTLYSTSNNDDIRLVTSDDSQYSGQYVILLEPVGNPSISGTSAGYQTYIVHVYIDRDDVNLNLKFTAGDVIADDISANINTKHSEMVLPSEFFHYVDIATATDPSLEGTNLCSHLTTSNGTNLFVSDKAIVDNRKIEPFWWRIRCDVERETSLSAYGAETINIGVIGSISDALSTWLTNSSTYSEKTSFVNPNPSTTNQWTIPSGTDLKSYDVIIMTGQSVDWDAAYPSLSLALAGGCIVIVDIGTNPNVTFTDSTKYVSTLGLTQGITDLLAGTKTFSGVASNTSWFYNQTAGFDISSADIKSSMRVGTSGSCAKSITIGSDLTCNSYPLVSDGTVAYAYVVNDSIIVTSLGFTSMGNASCGQILLNLIWGLNTKQTKIYTKSKSYYTTYSDWRSSWVAGTDTDGNQILSSSEMKLYSFSVVGSGDSKQCVRTLSQSPVSTLVSSDLSTRGESSTLLGASNMVYTLELSPDDGYVMGAGEINAESMPTAYSTNDSSAPFYVSPAYRIASYTNETSGSPVMPAQAAVLSVTARIVGKLYTFKNYNASWSLSQDFTYSTSSTLTTKNQITADNILYIDTWSDNKWTAPNVKNDHDQASSYNILHYGTQTDTKWYPWDGQSYRIESGSSGAHVKYVQQALNALTHEGRGPRTGKLVEDGIFGSKTKASVLDYQKRWNLTEDGIVDAGTAGHIMLNASKGTSLATLNTIWKKYGSYKNLIDGNPNTFWGRRTWINAKVPMMTDFIEVYLKTKAKVTSVDITASPIGTGSADYLNIYRIGGRPAADHSKYDWSFDKSKSLSSAKVAKVGIPITMTMPSTNELDMLNISFYQDHSYSGAAKMWAFSELQFYGTSTGSTTATKSATTTYTSGSLALSPGGILSQVITPAVPSGGTFSGWKNSAEVIAAAVKATMPAEIQALVMVDASIADNGDLTITIEPEINNTNEIRIGNLCSIKLNPTKTVNVWDNASTGSFSSANANTATFSYSAFGQNSIVGAMIEITSGAGTGQKTLIVANNASSVTYGTMSPAPSAGSNYRIYSVQSAPIWPSMSGLDANDLVWQLFYNVELVYGQSSATGCFAILDPSGNVSELATDLCYDDIIKLGGFSRIKPAAISQHSYSTSAGVVAGRDTYPVRYAMKPFCAVENMSIAPIAVKGVSGDQPEEPWGILIEAATYSNSVMIPSGGVTQEASDRNNISDDLSWLNSNRGKTVKLVYKISSGSYSSTFGKPYKDVINETASWVDDSNVKVSMTPLYVDDSFSTAGANVILTCTTTPSSIITVRGIDVNTGTVSFSSSLSLDPETDVIKATYTYREQYIKYLGTYNEIFDLCPYNGHTIMVDGSEYSTHSMTGTPIYTYALPSIAQVDNTVVTKARSVYHTLFFDMFDPSSDYFNPLALLLAKINIKNVYGDIMLVDTRRGGGGLSDNDVSRARKILPLDDHEQNRVDSLFDVGYLDGDAYLKGGTVVVRIPSKWKDDWIDRGQDPEVLARESVSRWIAAGKTFTIEWFSDPS